jgi:hypothetical protein
MRTVVARAIEHSRRQYGRPNPRLGYIRERARFRGVALGRAGSSERGARIHHRRQHVEREQPFSERCMLLAQVRPA